MSQHDGHRSRMKKRFLEHGLDNFADHEVLELLLFHSMPRQDTNAAAHALLERFDGSLAGVFDAPMSELTAVPGIGESSAALIKLIPQIQRRYMISQCSAEKILSTTSRVGEHFISLFYAERDEVVYLACLDAKLKLLACPLIFRGNVNSAQISVRKIVSAALTSNASLVILAHNHPSGIAVPSDDDERTTRRIRIALDAVGVELADHIVVADDDFVSMAANGFFDN